MKKKIGWTVVLLLVVALAGGVYVYERLDDVRHQAVLATNLVTLRNVIDQFHQDKGRHPESLQALVDAGYLRNVPVDPFTRSNGTWALEHEPGPDGVQGIVGVRSGAPGTTMGGQALASF